MQAASLLGISKRELEEDYFYDELVMMLDIYAYANASEQEKQRYLTYPLKRKAMTGEAVDKEAAGSMSLLG